MSILAEVAVPIPLANAFTYEVPASMQGDLVPGSRVLCDFGKQRIIGVVLRVGELPRPKGFELRPLRALVDREPVLPAELLSFLSEVADYYFAPIGEVLRLALPALERGRVETLEGLERDEEQGELFGPKGGVIRRVKRIGQAREIVCVPTTTIETPGSLRGQAKEILARLRGRGPEAIARLEEHFGNARSAAKKLFDLGLITLEERDRPDGPLFDDRAEPDVAPELTEPQRSATTRIEAALRGADKEGRAFLLHGVTGSGKTEVYLQAISACLQCGRGALMMVPEIALTPQLVGRFRARFGDGVAVLHSGLSDKGRHAMWKRLHAREVSVAIGARSALFAPVPDLGLVIVDEEHDSSFKQEEGVRYQARDMALLRAHRARAVVVLGSATPSLESVSLVERGKLGLLRLPDRANVLAALPEVRLVDLRRIGPGPTGDKLISLPLHRAIDENLKRGEQTILFLNRRGFAPSVVCMACGSVENCKSCSVSLTFHRGANRVKCHYCGFEASCPARCTSCGATQLSLEGLGTEKLESTLAEGFPGARIARLDRDVAAGMASEKILARVRRGEVDILVGTQMVTKGHDLANVTLVGVINADAALSMPDFRAGERTFQLLVQVAGRAGRHERPGRVIIQTRSPEHPAIVFAAKHDVDGFLRAELVDRRETNYPPIARLALLRIEAVDEKIAEAAARTLADVARTTRAVESRAVEVMGPAPAPIPRLRGRFRFRVMLRAAERPPLRAALSAVQRAMADLDRRIRAIIDVDPVSML